MTDLLQLLSKRGIFMDIIRQQFKRFLIGAGIILGILVTVFIVNQFVSFYDFLSRVHPTLGLVLVGLLFILFMCCIIRIGIYWIKTPKAIVLKENPTPEEYDEYLEAMLVVLKRNKQLKEFDFSKEDKVQVVTSAFKYLDELSLPLIKNTANGIFLTTSISQNGSLDSLLVLFSMIKLIWQLSNIYQTRPSVGSIGKLYLQVAGVVFMTRTIEETDLIETQMEPLIGALIGESVVSAIPGMVPITNLVVSSIMEGSLNAYLSLRVGLITQSYLGMEKPETKSTIKHHASRKSASYLSSIISDNSKVVVKSVMSLVKKAGTTAARRIFG